jgi:hypothetical protein
MKESSKSPISFRPPTVTEIQLKNLIEKWGDSRSQVIIRCIDRVWVSEFGNEDLEERTLDNGPNIKGP